LETTPEPLNAAALFIELVLIVIGLALLARLAVYFKFSPVPLYLLAGLAFSEGGLIPIGFPGPFIQIGAEIGVILLMFMLELAYSSSELTASLRSALPYGILNFVLNFTPGVIFALLLDLSPLAAILLGGVTYVSSSGIIAKTLNDLNWLGNRETPVILAVLVVEDLTMAIYLPLVVVLLVGEALATGLISLVVAVLTVVLVLVAAVRYGERISNVISSQSEEVVLLTILGMIMLVAGIAQQLQVSAAVGSFLVGIGLSGPVAEQARILLTPLRDLFAATFFLFFGLQIDLSSMGSVLDIALILVIVTTLTKFITGYVAAERSGIGLRGRFRAGTMMVPRGEFSIVIAGLGTAAGLDPLLLTLSATYVLIMAVLGPLLAKFVDPVVAAAQRRWRTYQTQRRAQLSAGD
jgi:monovalent cation:H+ antiporter-2, CPA2 family